MPDPVPANDQAVAAADETPAEEQPPTPTPAPRPAAVPDTPSTPSPATRSTAPEAAVDPVVEQLAAMFPGLDKETISDVLAGERGNADACVPLLLMLSGQEEAAREHVSSPVYHTQLASDEAMARQLAAEESWQSRPSQGTNYSHLAYEPRRPRGSSREVNASVTQDDGEPRQERDEFDQVVAGFKTAAQSAQKFGAGVFNKLSSKIKEMNLGGDQDDSDRVAGPSDTPTPQWKRPNLFKGPSAEQTPNQPVPATAKRTAPALPHGNRYAQLRTDSISVPPQPELTNEKPKAEGTGAAAAPKASPSNSPPDDAAPSKIELIDSTSSSGPRRTLADHDSDDDSLDAEYTRNPFERDD